MSCYAARGRCCINSCGGDTSASLNACPKRKNNGTASATGLTITKLSSLVEVSPSGSMLAPLINGAQRTLLPGAGDGASIRTLPSSAACCCVRFITCRDAQLKDWCDQSCDCSRATCPLLIIQLSPDAHACCLSRSRRMRRRPSGIRSLIHRV